MLFEGPTEHRADVACQLVAAGRVVNFRGVSLVSESAQRSRNRSQRENLRQWQFELGQDVSAVQRVLQGQRNR